jgi:hypothetical protein
VSSGEACVLVRESSDLFRLQPAAFDMVYVTWGAICWLPDIRRWAEIVAHFLKRGGSLYLAAFRRLQAHGPRQRPVLPL